MCLMLDQFLWGHSSRVCDISCFIWHLVTNLFIIFQTFSMVFVFRQFPSHSRTGIPLHSWNILVLLELLHGLRSCIKMYPICGNTTHSHYISISWIILLWYFVPFMLPFTFFSEERCICC